MRALIYARGAASTIQYETHECEQYCLEHNLEIGGTYSDEGLIPSHPKSRFKGLLRLIDDLRPGDCIVCSWYRTLPHFYRELHLDVPVRFGNKFQPQFEKDLRQLLEIEIEKQVQARLALINQSEEIK